MRILYYATGITGSGHLVLGLSIANAFRRRGVEHALTILSSSSTFSKLADRMGIQHQEIPLENETQLSAESYSSSALYQAITSLDPDVLIVDGQGRAHPRRLGIASHLGVLLDHVTIGCAKSILCGSAKEPPNRVGAWTPLKERAEQIGAAVRTRAGTTPVYVSVGHRISLARAIDVVLRCCKGYRLPETTRYAHRVAGGATLNLGSGQASWL